MDFDNIILHSNIKHLSIHCSKISSQNNIIKCPENLEILSVFCSDKTKNIVFSDLSKTKLKYIRLMKGYDENILSNLPNTLEELEILYYRRNQETIKNLSNLPISLKYVYLNHIDGDECKIKLPLNCDQVNIFILDEDEDWYLDNFNDTHEIIFSTNNDKKYRPKYKSFVQKIESNQDYNFTKHRIIKYNKY